MKLLHYSDKPFELDLSLAYASEHWKPTGLWVSVEGEDDWPSWCNSVGFGLDRLQCASEVALELEANVLFIKSVAELDAFNRRYSAGDRLSPHDLNWPEVREKYDGVIIAPYQWERRLDYMWYYGWDCASGVIWNLSAIRSVETCCES